MLPATATASSAGSCWQQQGEVLCCHRAMVGHALAAPLAAGTRHAVKHGCSSGGSSVPADEPALGIGWVLVL